MLLVIEFVLLVILIIALQWKLDDYTLENRILKEKLVYVKVLLNEKEQEIKKFLTKAKDV